MMGYRTPNIDRIAKEGALFTDWYGQQSCTAGRACFITGQVGFRTGMLKVGLPGAKEGLQARDVTIAEMSSRWAMPLASSERTILATGMSICPPRTGSMNSSALSITSMPKMSPSTPTTLRTRRCANDTPPAASSTPLRTPMARKKSS
jgi:hypothetical protein